MTIESKSGIRAARQRALERRDLRADVERHAASLRRVSAAIERRALVAAFGQKIGLVFDAMRERPNEYLAPEKVAAIARALAALRSPLAPWAVCYLQMVRAEAAAAQRRREMLPRVPSLAPEMVARAA